MEAGSKVPRTHESILDEVEECEEAILEIRHELRWYILGVRIFQVGFAVCGVGVVVVSIGVPLLEYLLQGVTTVAGIVAAIDGFALVMIRATGSYSLEEDTNHYLKDLRAAKLKLAKLKRELAYFDEYTFDHLPHREQYIRRLPDLIADYRKRADGYRHWFVITQITTIVLSAFITSLSGGWLDKYISIPWSIPVLSGAISILTSITLFFKFREKGFNLQQTADAIDMELKAYQLCIEDYEGLDNDKASAQLTKRTERLRKEQQKRQQQLEQSSQTEQKSLQQPTT